MRKNLRKYAVRFLVALLISGLLVGGFVAAAGIYNQVVVKATPGYVPVGGDPPPPNPGEPAGDCPSEMVQPVSIIFAVIGTLMVAMSLTTFPVNPVASIVTAGVLTIVTVVGAGVIQDLLNVI